MKFSLAIIGLVGCIEAIRHNPYDSADVTDLFNDNSDEAETMKSIAQAEEAHGVKLNTKDAE